MFKQIQGQELCDLLWSPFQTIPRSLQDLGVLLYLIHGTYISSNTNQAPQHSVHRGLSCACTALGTFFSLAVSLMIPTL